ATGGNGIAHRLDDASDRAPGLVELADPKLDVHRVLSIVVVDVADDPGLTPGGDAGAPLDVEETISLRRTGVRWQDRAGFGLAPGSGCLQARARQGHDERYPEQQCGGYDSTIRCHGVPLCEIPLGLLLGPAGSPDYLPL